MVSQGSKLVLHIIITFLITLALENLALNQAVSHRSIFVFLHHLSTENLLVFARKMNH